MMKREYSAAVARPEEPLDSLDSTQLDLSPHSTEFAQVLRHKSEKHLNIKRGSPVRHTHTQRAGEGGRGHGGSGT